MNFNVGPVRVQACFANHPGKCVGYRLFTSDGSIAFFPDNELPRQDASANRKMIDFLRGADVLIMDTQFDTEEYQQHTGWGHGCLDDVVALALQAEVKKLFLFHHDPNHDDAKISQMLAHARQTRRRPERQASGRGGPRRGDGGTARGGAGVTGQVYFHPMLLTPDQIVEEVRRWPQEQVTELLDRLACTLRPEDPALEETWKQENRRRIAGLKAAPCVASPERKFRHASDRSWGGKFGGLGWLLYPLRQLRSPNRAKCLECAQLAAAVKRSPTSRKRQQAARTPNASRNLCLILGERNFPLPRRAA